MTTTFSYDVPPYRRRDGTYNVKIRMIHNREVVRKPSTIFVTKAQLSRDLHKIRDYETIDMINRQIERLRRIVEDIDGSEFYDADSLWDEIIERLKGGKGFRLDFFTFAEEKMKAMEPKTAEGYRTSINALKRFLGKSKLDVNEIDYKMMLSFRSFLETEPALDNGSGKHIEKSKGSRAISYYLSCIRALHNMARDEYNTEEVVLIPKQPFKKGLIPQQPPAKHRVLTLAELRKIASVELDPGSRAAMARDIFMLSFALIGMNTADIYDISEDDISDEILTYNRNKTDSVRADKAMMKVRIEPEVREIMERHRGINRFLDFSERYADAKGLNSAVNKGLKEIGEMVGVEGLTSYHARHTWATLARNDCRVDFYTVHEALNHAKRGADRITDVYVERDWSTVWKANRKVLDLLKRKR